MPTPFANPLIDADTAAAATAAAASSGFDLSSLWFGLIGGVIVGILLGWYLHARTAVLSTAEEPPKKE